MTPTGFIDHRGVESQCVVRAEQPPRFPGREGCVQQRFVALAFDELDGTALLPDRLSDSAGPATRAAVLLDEIAPRGNDSRRVGADARHVREVDQRGVRPPGRARPPPVLRATTSCLSA